MTIQGPALVLQSLVSGEEPFDSLDAITTWAQGLGFTGVSLPTADKRIFDLEAAAGDAGYARNVRELLARKEITVCELSLELPSALVAMHPAYDEALDLVVPDELRGNRAARERWAARQLGLAAHAAFHLGVQRVVCESGSLLGPYLQSDLTRPAGIADTAFAELGRRWIPLLDVFDAVGVDVCFALAPDQDVRDGATFERFLAAAGDHPRAKLVYDPGRLYLSQIDYLDFIPTYAERIGAFHLSDAEFVPSARHAAHGSLLPSWERPARLRTLGEGQLDLAMVFDAMFRFGFEGWAALDWECAVRDVESGVGMSGAFITVALDRPEILADQEERPVDEERNRRALGLT